MTFLKELWADFFRGLKFWSVALIGGTVFILLVVASVIHPKLTACIVLPIVSVVIIWATGVFLELKV